MYRVLIVDDEIIIRRGIRNSIPWQEHDMTVVGEASDGKQAIDMTEELHPDIVIADICMPEIDGLKMSEVILEKYPETRIVILTGYDEFEYAQRACRIGISDYVLKPTDSDDLMNVLEKVKSSINEERNSRIRMELLEQELKKHMPIIRENFLNRLIAGTVPLIDMEEGRRIIGISSDKKFFRIGVVDADCTCSSEFSGRMEMLRFAVKNICSQILNEEETGWAFYNTFGEVTLLLYFEQKDSIQKETLRIVEKIQHSIGCQLSIPFSIGMGKCSDTLEEVKKSFSEAREALGYRFLVGEGSIIFIEDVKKNSHEPELGRLKEIERELLSRIEKGRAENVMPLLDAYFDALKKEPSITPQWAKAKCYELICNLALIASSIRAGNGKNVKEPEELYSQIYQSPSLGEVYKGVYSFMGDLLGEISNAMSSQRRKIVTMCMDYIKAHFKEELSVSEIADRISISPNYLSRIFKKEIGEGCVEYINRVRMEEAKKLLKSSLYMTYEIAEMVGFKDANYFSLTFKKLTGMSPTEYRNS